MRVALIEASFRIFSLVTTRAVCPTLSRLGRLVLQEVLAFGCPAAVGVAVTVVAASVGVTVRAAAVGVGDAGTAVGVADDAAVTISVATILVTSSVAGSGDGALVSVAG
jgi:hypothetical protein